ncbi:iron ABC transporter permease [Microbacterium sp. AK031]|uniref:FecCD family ABC transporter permease n=1 Tax=Microbacterium sp. AK031 TaxID=2723076 RepID=UPI002169A4A7|nr:iron chelate uptake ABC transporter family permease subunit [Microbacterium sp. AK031]MCS3844894.1 iron complex transport system permease protein [Microbacterium sp. AK031]
MVDREQGSPLIALPSLAAVSDTRRLWSRRTLAIALVLGGLVAVVLSVGVAVTLGPADVSLVNVRDILLNHLGLAEIPVRVSDDAIVWQERLPRALVAAACGAGLGLCGAILQSLLRNPLADPFVLGVSSGASTGAVAIGVLGIGGSAVGLSGGAFIGALVAFGLVLLLARFTSAGTAGVILAGVASTQLFSALTSLVVFAFADSDETRGVMFWLLGSLEGMRWDDVGLSTVVVGIGAVICLASARALDAFAFGEDVAASLGIHVARTRILLLILTALLTATLVSIAGAIGFVGLVLPHAARLLFGQRHSRVIPATIILGAVFMVWVDAGSRVAFAPTPLPVGVGTALVGVPVFVLLLLRRRRRA